MSKITATYTTTDRHAAQGTSTEWYTVTGLDIWAGDYNRDNNYGLTSDGSIVDADGCPLTAGDPDEIAVRAAIEASEGVWDVGAHNQTPVSLYGTRAEAEAVATHLTTDNRAVTARRASEGTEAEFNADEYLADLKQLAEDEASEAIGMGA